MNNAMDSTYLAVGAAVVAVLLALIGWVLTHNQRGKQLNKEYYESKWQDMQKLLKDSATWPLAVIEADKLLDHALKARRFKGKNTGERLVAAQHDIQANDDVWFGHKLRNKLVHESSVKLTERHVKDALMGIKRALKDLGAL